MNSKLYHALFLTLALLIVLPVLGTVNGTPAHNASSHAVLVADGSPAPPPAPNPWLQSEPELVVDGSPAPPPAPNPWMQPQTELMAA